MHPEARPASKAAAVTRLTWVAAALLIWGVLILAKLFSLQVTQHAKYAAIARSQQEDNVHIPAARGTILDRNGQPLAISVPVDSISVNPLQIADTKLAAEVLGGILHLDQQVLHSRLQWAREKHKGFLWVKHKIDAFETERLKSLHLDWVAFHTESARHYPKGQTASHILGAVYKGEEGAAGIERAMDKTLKGEDGAERLVMDVKRRGIDSHLDRAAQPGTQLTLTIDERMQYVAERELAAGVIAKHARSGSAIVMDPYNGEILALANYPTYDPNKPPMPGDDPMSRFDLGVSVPFEPGSIFKVVTLSAALETTNLRPDSMIPTGNGVLRLPGRIIHESHHGFGTITMQQVLEHSSNIGAILIGQRVGRENMYEYARRFGFGQKTGLPLPAESSGLLRPLTRWGTTSLASISMGQEVSTTSAQLARLCAVIANGGMLVKPKLILKKGDKAEPTAQPVRVLKPETVMMMRMMMEGVVLRGTAHLAARLDGYTSAGKTGTAQIFDVKSHHYTHNYNASFMGFTPVVNPRLVIVVTVNGTTGDAGMGAAAAAPVFKTIATEALRMMDVPKDIPEDPNAKPKKPEKVVPVDDLSIADLGGGRSIMEEDPSIRELLAAEKMPIEASDDIPPAKGPVVPDFRGKSLRDAVEIASAEGLNLSTQGSGVARAQMPRAGSPSHRGERVRVVFAR